MDTASIIGDDWEDFVSDYWPKGLEALRVIVKPSTTGRVGLAEIRQVFKSHYRNLHFVTTADRMEDDELRALLNKAGIQAVPGSADEFFAERLPDYDRRPEQRAKIEYLETHFGALWNPGKAERTKTPRVSAADRARRVGGKDVTRLKTGLPTLDAATRGGILLRKVAVFGGAPGAGKTALLVRSAYRWLCEGVTVGILAADEDADGLLIRLGQLHGLSRDALENGDVATRTKLAEWCMSVPLILADGDEDGGTIEELSREVRVKAGKGPSALIVDSMQTARSEVAVPKGADLRAKINATVGALKRAAKVEGHVVLASSELSKAAYRSKDAAENVNALAAFKESGDIEYGTALAVVLTSVAGSSELVDAAVVKNRLGPTKPSFQLKLIHDRADVHEATAREAATTDPLYFLKLDIRASVEKAAGYPMTKNQICERVGGQRQKVLKAINQLLDAHELHHDRHGVRFPLPGDPGYVADNKYPEVARSSESLAINS